MHLTPDMFGDLMTLVIEESSEVTKADCKMIRFGPNTVKPSTGRTGLQELKIELVDLAVVLQPLLDSNFFEPGEVNDLIAAKKQKLKKYHPEIWGDL